VRDSAAPVQVDENTLLLKQKISGGYAVWREDIAVVTRLKTEIAASIQARGAANALLSNEAAEKERYTQVKTRLELFAAFEREIAPYEQRLDELLRDAQMGAAMILVCYIKRCCNFLIQEMRGEESVSYNEYVVYILELAEMAQIAGTKCLAYCSLNGRIEMRRAMLFYDFFYWAAEWAVTNRRGGMVAHTLSGGGRLTMKLMLPGVAPELALPERMTEEINVAGGLIEKKDLDSTRTGLFLSFPEGGGCGA